MAEYGGWTGKTLRADLSTGKITTEDTIAKYKDYLGGTGVGYKVLFDEVPVGTKAWDPENRIIFGVGPFTGSGAPTSSRVQITTLFPPNGDELPGSGHMGGHWGAELKYAGWDNIIVQGKAKNPVWIAIDDDKVEIRDASRIWGSGIFRATAEICAEMGEDTSVAAIGQGGENLNRYSVVMCDRSHSAGGVGSVLGSKNLKAIGVRGTGSVKIMAKPADWEKLINEYVFLMGANNNHVVPRNKEPWAEFSGNTRWRGSKGVYWGAAAPPLEIGYCPGDDMNKIGYRTQKGQQDHGDPVGQTNLVRMDGCHSCPIRCHVMMDVPALEQYGVSRYQGNTCVGNGTGRNMYVKTPGSGTMERLILSQLGSALFDDYGVWLGYSAEQQMLSYLYTNGFWKEKLDEKEYEGIPWALMEAQDPAWLMDVVPRIAYQRGVFGQAMAEGPAWMVKRWPELAELFTAEAAPHFWKPWHGYHHSIESGGQVGVILCMLWNRDHNSHVHLNFYGNGLPLEIQQEIGAEIFGSKDAVTANHNYGPFNEAKARFAAASVLYAELHNALTLCSYTLPVWASPHKSRNYRGDYEMESKVYTALTGEKITQAELEKIGLRIISMWRADTALRTKEIDQRNKQDLLPHWIFEGDQEPFTKGADRMDEKDMEVAKDMLYEELGWDVKTGMRTRKTLEELGMKDVADKLAAAKLLPA